MQKAKLALISATMLGGIGLATVPALAVPVGGLAPAATQQSSDIQNVRWVCGPYRCFWRPNYRPYGFYGRPGWRGGYGWRHRWHRGRW